MKLVYFIGEPGAGKSTLIRHALKLYDSTSERKPFAHLLYRKPNEDKVRLVQLGDDDPLFPGTDRLSMSVLPLAVAYVVSSDVEVIIGEGDRLATFKFLEQARATREVTLVLCHASRALLDERRAARGTEQNANWLKGRRTKVQNLWEKWPGAKVRLNMANPLDALVYQVRELLDT